VSSSPVTANPATQSASQARTFTLRERLLLWLISWSGYLAIALICPTLRYSISWEEQSIAPNTTFEKPVIYSFWHRCVFPAAWMWRNLGIAVMVSRSFDGEYIARIIEKLGFVSVRGSSSRGGTEALLGMSTQLERGAGVAFTIDGPRGPKYVAKPGPIRLSKVTGMPMSAFYVALSDAWVLRTWDQFMIPKPFSKVLARVSVRVTVPRDAGDTQLQEFQMQLQLALERVTKFAEENVSRVGSDEFPVKTQSKRAPGAVV
jgi:lysophospholipid acyltransferase (LPLAT)-like uncharacterized protein